MSLLHNKNNSFSLTKTHPHPSYQHQTNTFYKSNLSMPIIPLSLSKHSCNFPSYPLSSISNAIPFQQPLPISYDYLSSRKLAMMYIKDIIKVFNFPQQILYKAITYMDTYFQHKQSSNINIYHISAVCVLMALKYNDCCVHNNINQLFALIKTIPNVLDIEFDILNALDYDLGMMSVYDYICILFKEGVLFTNDNNRNNEDDYKYEVEDLLQCVMDLLLLLVDDERFVDFNPFIMAITIIRIVCEMNSALFDKEMFQYTCNVNFKQVNYVQCLFVIKMILPYIMKDNAQSKYNNNKFNYNNIIINDQRNDYNNTINNNNVYSTSFPTTVEYSNTCNINQKQSSYIKYSFSPDFYSSSTVDSLCSPYDELH